MRNASVCSSSCRRVQRRGVHIGFLAVVVGVPGSFAAIGVVDDEGWAQWVVGDTNVDT